MGMIIIEKSDPNPTLSQEPEWIDNIWEILIRRDVTNCKSNTLFLTTIAHNETQCLCKVRQISLINDTIINETRLESYHDPRPSWFVHGHG